MTNIAKRALGLASALVFMGAMALVASPVQATDVDTRIEALERELAQLKQSQEAASEERALAAEMKGPKFSYKPGGGLTIAAADNQWSIKFAQRLQAYSTFYMTQDNPEKGYQNGQWRIRRFRPSINVTSAQGFYAVNWTFSGKDTVAFDGDGYLNLNKLNPFLPQVGWGYNPSFSGISKSSFGSEDPIFSDALAMGGAQDGSIVLSWKSLPAMGMAKISHLNIAVGHDELDEYGSAPPVTDNSRSFAASIGVAPLGGSKMMGGVNMASLTYKFAYESLQNGYSEGVSSLGTVNRTKSVTLAEIGKVSGDHKYYGHSFTWSPLKFINLVAHHVTWEADAAMGTKIAATDNKSEVILSTAAQEDRKVTEMGFGVRMWLWGPKSGAMGGSKSEGGISVAPTYNVIDIKKRGTMNTTGEAADTMMRMGGEVTNTSVIVDFHIPGGWFTITGMFDNYSCDKSVCASNVSQVSNASDDGSFNTFTLGLQYRF